MTEFKNFAGINNVLPAERLQPNELQTALNVDVGLNGEVCRRQPLTALTDQPTTSLWETHGYLLGLQNGDLVRLDGSTATVLYPSLGFDRVWYVNLPDGRTAFSNGLINGITDGTTVTSWGVPTPTAVGDAIETVGGLNPGEYRYAITYVRVSDGLEGAPSHSLPVTVAEGGLVFTGLPERAGHRINVYLSGRDGSGFFLAGTTDTDTFAFVGTNTDLVVPCRTEFLSPAPAGTVMALWRGRVVVAQGSLLWASLPFRHEFFDLRRDFKQMSSPITALVPVDDGLYVGTEHELAFLGGVEWDKLVYQQCVSGGVALGSGVSVTGEYLMTPKGPAEGRAGVFIADGVLVYGLNGGRVIRVTEGRYRTTTTEVSATFRVVDGVPQYVAVPL